VADELAVLDRRITDALAALRYARALAERSANSSTRWEEDAAERTLDRLLDRRPRVQLDEQAEVLARAPAGTRRPG